MAAKSVELQLRAQIIPSSCSIDLTRDIIDFGSINLNLKNSSQHRELIEIGAEPTDIIISCDSSAQVSFNISDNSTGGQSDQGMFGLTDETGKSLGFYKIFYDKHISQNNTGKYLLVSDNNIDFLPNGSDAINSGRYYSAQGALSNEPLYSKRVIYELIIFGYLNSAAVDPQHRTDIFGSATIEIIVI